MNTEQEDTGHLLVASLDCRELSAYSLSSIPSSVASKDSYRKDLNGSVFRRKRYRSEELGSTYFVGSAEQFCLDKSSL